MRWFVKLATPFDLLSRLVRGRDLHHFGVLRCVEWQFVTDVLVQVPKRR